MADPSIKLPEELIQRMRAHPDVKWDSYIKTAVERKLEQMEVLEKLLEKSQLTEEEAERIGHSIKAGQRRRFHPAG